MPAQSAGSTEVGWGLVTGPSRALPGYHGGAVDMSIPSLPPLSPSRTTPIPPQTQSGQCGSLQAGHGYRKARKMPSSLSTRQASSLSYSRFFQALRPRLHCKYWYVMPCICLRERVARLCLRNCLLGVRGLCMGTWVDHTHPRFLFLGTAWIAGPHKRG